MRFLKVISAVVLKRLEIAYRVQRGNIPRRLLEVAQFLVFRRFDIVLFIRIHMMLHSFVHADILTYAEKAGNQENWKLLISDEQFTMFLLVLIAWGMT